MAPRAAEPKTGVYSLQIGEHIKAEIRQHAAAHKRTMTAECNDLIERGLDFRKMLERSATGNFLFDLFAAARQDASIVDYVNVLRLHFPPGQLAEAFAAVKP